MPAKELQELEQWKVGQKVIVHGNSNGCFRDSIATITRITDGRGGTIYTDDYAFDLRGCERSSDTWHSKFIEPATEEDRMRIKGEVSKSWLVGYRWPNLTGEQAIKIEALLKEMGINIREKKS